VREVQGARAAYGTCFVCADHRRPSVIPAFLWLPTPCLMRHIQRVFGNKIPPRRSLSNEWALTREEVRTCWKCRTARALNSSFCRTSMLLSNLQDGF